MAKVSLKTAVISLFCGIFLVLGACIIPVDYQSFLEDEKVEDITRGTKIDDQTGDNLRARGGRIEGLKNDKYYMVESEIDEEGKPVNPDKYPMYVTDYPWEGDFGGLLDGLGHISKISGGIIRGMAREDDNGKRVAESLTNLNTYTVRAASAFPESVEITYADDGGPAKKIKITEKEIEIPGADGDGGGGYAQKIKVKAIDVGNITGTGFINLSDLLKSKSYEATAVSIKDFKSSPNDWSSETVENLNAFELKYANTAVDYVFSGKDPVDFKYLTVITGDIISVEPEKPKVKVDDKTGDGLIGGDGIITGLKNNRYYMVDKELDPNGVPVNEEFYPAYVTDHPGVGPGGLYEDLGKITKISGGIINGWHNTDGSFSLNNDHTYTVRAAAPFGNGTVTYVTNEFEPSVIQITGGVVNIDGINGTGSLDISSLISGTYEVIAVSTNNSSNSWNWDSKTIDDWTSFNLEGANTEVDYVFVKDNDLSDFKVLKVIIGPVKKPVEPGIQITLTFTIDDKTTVSPSGATIAIGTYGGSSTAALTVNITGGTASSIKWYYNNDLSTVISTTNNLVLNNDAGKNYLVVGDHLFTVIAEIGGVPYSAEFKLKVTE